MKTGVPYLIKEIVGLYKDFKILMKGKLGHLLSVLLLPLLIFSSYNWWDPFFKSFFIIVLIIFIILIFIHLTWFSIIFPGWLIKNFKKWGGNTTIYDSVKFLDMDLVKIRYTLQFYLIALTTSTYIIAIWKWFSTEHLMFWTGFKELLWALCPIANIFYALDIWVSFYLYLNVLLFG